MLLMTAEEVATVCYAAGWRDSEELHNAVRVAFAESFKGEYIITRGAVVAVNSGGFKVCDAHTIGTNTNGTTDRGLLQVNSIWTSLSDADAMDPLKNAKFAHDKIWAVNKSFMPWAAFNNLTYQKYYEEAAAGVAASWLRSKGRPLTGLSIGAGGI